MNSNGFQTWNAIVHNREGDPEEINVDGKLRNG